MAEWSILLLLVPAIVVPVVMLVGFAGCQAIWGVEDYQEGEPTRGASEFGDPIIDSAFGKSVSIITLKWKYDDPAAPQFEFERTKLPEQSIAPPIFAPAPPFEYDDPGLEAETNYLYRVRAVDSNGDAISNWSGQVAATTLSFQPTFDAESKPETQLTLDEEGWEGNCLVQRIEPALLMLSGTKVRLTLRASSFNDAYIDRIYLSQPADDPQADEWDSAPDGPPGGLTKVYDIDDGSPPLVVPANSTNTLLPIDYVLEKEQSLLIAVDFTPADPNATPPGPFSGIRYADAVSPSDAVAFYRQGAEAATDNRSADYTPANRIYLIEKIEVG